MLSNAVTSAVGRLYANPVAEESRLAVRRVEAVSRVAAAATNGPAERDEREQAAQRLALTSGVRAVFESVAGVESTAAAGQPDGVSDAPDTNEVDKTGPVAAADSGPDPLLDAAILRFIHSVFRSLAEVEGNPEAEAPWAAQDNTVLDVGRAQQPGFNSSRDDLGRRIDALAARLAAGGAPAELLTGDDADDAEFDPIDRLSSLAAASGAAGRPVAGRAHGELGQAFAGVLQALRGNLGGGADAGSAEAPTRGNLVNLMHRLAQAMQGAPPVDAGLPTLGGLLHARA